LLWKGGASLEALIQDCRIFYRSERLENSNAPTILFLHGWGCDGNVFSFFQKAINTSWISVDFPGHGLSGEPPMPWGVPEYAEQIYQLLQALSVEKVNIVAHSFGGRVAIYLASHHPEVVGKMIITGGAGIRKPASETQSKRQKQYQKLKKMVLFFGRLPGCSGLTERLMAKLRERYGSPDYVRLNERMRATFVKVISQDLSEFLSDIQASTLLIWGSNDTETPLWMGQKMEQEMKDAALVIFENDDHWAYWHQYERFNRVLDAFLKGDKQ
jgi:pimeloyl-ACP methyl ester carboxylesterase